MERTLSTQRVFDGKLLKIDKLEVELDNGNKAIREIVNFPEVVVILPLRKKDNKILCVRQFRKPVEGLLLEAIAGKIDPGESAIDAAKRELKEETGYEAFNIRKIGLIYPTPGYSNEIQHYFFVEIEGEPGKQSCDDEERIQLEWLGKEGIANMVSDTKPIDGKLMIAMGLLSQLNIFK